MENQDDPKDDSTEPASDDSSAPEAAEVGDERSKRAPGSKSSKGAKKRASARGSSDARLAKAPASGVSSGLVVAGLLALAVGAAGGWFGHEAKAKDKLRADSAAPAPSGSAAANGPCRTWANKVCAGTGEQSAACGAAKGALDLLTPPTCEVALAGVPATLAKVKAGRASCDTLSARLCKDLPPDSGACNIVKERTPSFPSARCDEMLQHYDDVIQELRQLDQQQGMMGMAPPGAAPMAPPPGAPHL